MKGDNVIPDPLVSTGGAAMAPPSAPEIIEMAGTVHKLFCERFYRLPFELFEEDWKESARTTLRMCATPEMYIDAMVPASGQRWVDPFDLHGDAAEQQYLRHAHDTWETELLGYQQGNKRIAQHPDDAMSFIRHAAFSALDPVCRVVKALKHMRTECMKPVVAIYGRTALATLKGNPLLQKHIADEEMIPVVDLISAIENVLQEQSGATGYDEVSRKHK